MPSCGFDERYGYDVQYFQVDETRCGLLPSKSCASKIFASAPGMVYVCSNR